MLQQMSQIVPLKFSIWTEKKDQSMEKENAGSVFFAPYCMIITNSRQKIGGTRANILPNFICQHLLQFPLSLETLKEEQMTT